MMNDEWMKQTRPATRLVLTQRRQGAKAQGEIADRVSDVRISEAPSDRPTRRLPVGETADKLLLCRSLGQGAKFKMVGAKPLPGLLPRGEKEISFPRLGNWQALDSSRIENSGTLY
jgi:hypothetical protein